MILLTKLARLKHSGTCSCRGNVSSLLSFALGFFAAVVAVVTPTTRFLISVSFLVLFDVRRRSEVRSCANGLALVIEYKGHWNEKSGHATWKRCVSECPGGCCQAFLTHPEGFHPS